MADRPIQLSVEGIDANPTLIPCDPDATRPELDRRFRDAGPRFRELAVGALESGRADETSIDAACEPPQTCTYGGMVPHVLTFSEVRRTLAIGVLETAGIDDLGAGDPMHLVGGNGDDAVTIGRRYAPSEPT